MNTLGKIIPDGARESVVADEECTELTDTTAARSLSEQKKKQEALLTANRKRKAEQRRNQRRKKAAAGFITPQKGSNTTPGKLSSNRSDISLGDGDSLGSESRLISSQENATKSQENATKLSAYQTLLGAFRPGSRKHTSVLKQIWELSGIQDEFCSTDDSDSV
jgi:hypothetical protein